MKTTARYKGFGGRSFKLPADGLQASYQNKGAETTRAGNFQSVLDVSIIVWTLNQGQKFGLNLEGFACFLAIAY